MSHKYKYWFFQAEFLDILQSKNFVEKKTVISLVREYGWCLAGFGYFDFSGFKWVSKWRSEKSKETFKEV